MTEKEREPYPWLTIHEDGSMEADLNGYTSVEADRCVVIMQELRAGRLVLSEAGPPRLTREEMGRVYVAHAEDCPSPAQCTCDNEGLKARVRAALADTETGAG